MIYSDISRTSWIAIQQRLQAEAGIVVNTDEGNATHEVHAAFLSGNITISWVYSESDSSLTVGCTHKPDWLAESVIDTKLTQLVEGGN